MGKKTKNDDTKRYNSSEINKKSKKRKNKDNSKNKKSIFFKVLKILVILFILMIIVVSGVVVGVIYGGFGKELKIDKEELVIPYENSTVYDKDGNLIATLSEGTKRKCISLSEMGEYLPKAYVAIEDERFYEHSGVDIKRTAYATITYITHMGESSFGGSTITQQLVKNITNDKEDSGSAGVIRKIKEMAKATQVEQYLSKAQILELYLNLIFIGGNDINGVELGAIYYFNKKPIDLSIAECAFMAGINNSPNLYKPFSGEEKDKEIINKRTKAVLKKMLECEYINQEQYDNSIAEVDKGLKFENGNTSPTIEVSYTVESALNQLLEKLMTEKNMSQSLAETYLYSSGLKIYTTQDTAIQNTLEEVIKQDKYFTSTKVTKKDENGKEYKETISSIPTMVIMDHKTGNVVASATAVGEKGSRVTTTKIGYLNIPTKLRKQTGSSMKPIAVIAPGLESGVLTASTVYDDVQTTFGNNYTPKNYYPGFRGLMTIRSAIEISANIPHVKALSDIGMETAIDFCEKVGLPRFEEEGLSLALGGLSKGVTITEMAGAYSAIANDGTYVKPTYYRYVTDKNDEIVIEAEQKTVQAMTPQNAYIEKSILKQPVVGPSGTASYCAIKGMDVAAKTGTTNGDYDRWLCGFTPYYTAVCWYGYETNAAVKFSGNPAGKIWDEVMTKIHEGLPNAQFERPEGIVDIAVCKGTGLKASESCTDVYTEVFNKDNIPETCDGHTMAMICTQTNLLCCNGCPFGEWRTFNGVPPKERNAKWTRTDQAPVENSGSAPTDVCPHTASPVEVPVPSTPIPEQNPTPTVPETPKTDPTVPENTIPTTPENSTPTVPENTIPTTPENPTPTVPENTTPTPTPVVPETPAPTPDPVPSTPENTETIQ